jgi:hypothetical protein
MVKAKGCPTPRRQYQGITTAKTITTGITIKLIITINYNSFPTMFPVMNIQHTFQTLLRN